MESNRYSFRSRECSLTSWYTFEKAFSREELYKIESEVALLNYQRATVFVENQTDRISNIKWIPHTEQWDWLYHKLMELANIANDDIWGFDLKSAPEAIQYTEYDSSESGKYEWHQDIGPGIASDRKISITVQLSDDDEYEGGDLCIWQGGPSLDENIEYTPRSAGNVTLFPSYLVHSVKPVTKGIRKSFVLWLGGDPFK
jgi:PKHD-type hydroxylase